MLNIGFLQSWDVGTHVWDILQELLELLWTVLKGLLKGVFLFLDEGDRGLKLGDKELLVGIFGGVLKLFGKLGRSSTSSVTL